MDGGRFRTFIQMCAVVVCFDADGGLGSVYVKGVKVGTYRVDRRKVLNIIHSASIPVKKREIQLM